MPDYGDRPLCDCLRAGWTFWSSEPHINSYRAETRFLLPAHLREPGSLAGLYGDIRASSRTGHRRGAPDPAAVLFRHRRKEFSTASDGGDRRIIRLAQLRSA